MANLAISTDGRHTTVTDEFGRLLGHIIDTGFGQHLVEVRPTVGAPVWTVVDTHTAAVEKFRNLTHQPAGTEVPCGDVTARQASLTVGIREDDDNHAEVGIYGLARTDSPDVSVLVLLDVAELTELVDAVAFALARLAVTR